MEKYTPWLPILLLLGHVSLFGQITSNRTGDKPVSGIRFEPIEYHSGPRIEPNVHAYITLEIQPHLELRFFNARLTDSATGSAHWMVQNLPLLPFNRPQIISYQINVEVFGSTYESLHCEYHVGSSWISNADFPVMESLDLVPEPTVIRLASGSDDLALAIGEVSPALSIHPSSPDAYDYLNRGCDVPNVDLDSTNRYPDDHPISNDKNACGPAAAANSLEWLIKQHPELAGDTTSLRSKLDSLKGYMNLGKKDPNGVRFDSMVVGKLTLIDKLKLPIRVKYQTKHDSGIVRDPLASTEPPGHTADNHGKPKAYPQFDWLKREMDEGEDVELQIGWYGPIEDDGLRSRHGGHWVVVTGYFSAGMVKGIYFKDDDDQIRAGGTREKYGNWAPGDIPYLEGMTDGRGNIAIIESVVSESYDPTVKFDEGRASTLPSPWGYISLTDTRMKPGYPFVSPVIHPFPWLPVVVGGASLGTLIYVIASDDKEENCTFTVTAQSVSSVCNLPNGSVAVITAPSDVYTYQWSNGATSATLQNVAAGNYTATISREGTTCSQVVNATVANTNMTFTTDISVQPSDCGMTNGSATASVSPVGSYTYNWSNGATGATASFLAPGSYTVVVSAGGSCTQDYNVTISENPPQHSISISTTPSGCGVSDGTATAIIEPPDEYVYTWSDGQTGPVATGLGAGEYTVSVSLPGTNCTQSASFSVDELPPGHSVSISTTPSGCGLGDGTATATVDPPGEYEYSWSNGQTGPEATNLTAGEHSISVSVPGSTCVQIVTFTVEELPAGHSVSVTTTPSGCGLADGTATATVDPPGEYEYAWSNGQIGPEATSLGAGEHSVSVSVPGSTCVQIVTFTIEELPAGHTVSVTTTPSGCGLSDGSATATVDPPGEYEYAWSNGQIGPEATSLGAGEHNISVSVPGSTCLQIVTFTVEELPAGHTVSVTTTPSGCGLSDGSATAIVDPPGVYEHAWSNGQNGPEATGLGAGDHSVSVSVPGSTCLQVTSFSIVELPSNFTVMISTTPAGCGIADGTATTLVDPPGEYIYTWSNGQTGPEATGMNAGTYSLTVTSAGSTCSVVTSFDIEQTGGGFTATFTTTDADCGIANGSASVVIDPPGEYTYQWSNDQTGPDLQGVSAGTYMVVVTDNNDCTGSFEVTIEETPATYISDITSTPGNCLGGGQISFTLQTPGNGPLVVQVEGPQNGTMQTLIPGTYQLSAFMPATPGNYIFTVFDQETGEACTEIVAVDVSDNTPPLVATDDFYTTPGGQTLFENALDNDSGFSIQMTSVGDVFGGAVTFNASGAFTYTPDPGFSGDASFVYTVTDACGATATAVVIIVVEEVVCEFTLEYDFNPASCGLSDGFIHAGVVEPGTYTFIWNNGVMGPINDNIPAGSHTLTITETNLGCDQVFTIELSENPAEHIHSIEVAQPTCGSPGEILFTATSNTGNPLVMSVQHPNGSNLFFIFPGEIQLSDYVSITPGEYIVSVFDTEAGSDCSESFMVIIEPATSGIEILLEGVMAPSEPTAMDGVAIIVASVPGILPYSILLNGAPYGVANDHTVFVEGLGVGDYTIQLIDATGCASNILLVNIPFPDGILSLGTIFTPVSAAMVELAAGSSSPVYSNGWEGRYQYWRGRTPHVVRVLYVPRWSNHIQHFTGWVEAEHRSSLVRMSRKKYNFNVEYGLGLRSGLSRVVDIDPGYLSLNVSSRVVIGKTMYIQVEAGLRGWKRIEWSNWMIRWAVPIGN